MAINGPLQQKQLFSPAPCKCPLSFHSKLHSFSQLLTVSTLFKHYPVSWRNHASVISAKMAVREERHARGGSGSVSLTEMVDGSLPLGSKDREVYSSYKKKQHDKGKSVRSASVGDKVRNGYGRLKIARKEASSSVNRDIAEKILTSKSKGRAGDGVPVAGGEREKGSNKRDKEIGSGFSSSEPGEALDTRKAAKHKHMRSNSGGKAEKKNKKSKVDSEETELRIGLDMCSKRGDVMGAISLYDRAMTEGTKLGQYHYNVLLYLCSSAAGGVVLPAKSGSSGSSSNNFSCQKPKFGLTVTNTKYSNEHLMGTNKNEESEDEFREISKSTLRVYNGFSIRSHLGGSEQRFSDTGIYPSGHNARSSESDTEENGVNLAAGVDKSENETNNIKGSVIQVSDNVKRYSLARGFEIYEKMCQENIPLSEAALTSVARMAMSMGQGDMAFEVVKKMKELGINARLRSYGPALFCFCNNGDVQRAFEVEEHMLDSGVYPEEPELEALLRMCVEAGRGDKVYYLLHKLRTSVRQVSPSTADLIERWFSSEAALKVGKQKWNESMVLQAIENCGGGWHGLGWLGWGKWKVSRTIVVNDGVCMACGEKLTTIDLDPNETENFARLVAEIAGKREGNSNFQKFQKWLEYYGPFEAVVDAANVGLFSQRKFLPSKVNAVVNGIRQKLPSKRWPLIVVHNRRVSGGKMEEPGNKKVLEKWRNADALYATPTGSNDDWYWLYAAISNKCLIVTNDEMRDHTFQLLGNDFFPKWKERHQVHFTFNEGSPEFYMPPPCSVVIQESKRGHWHIPIIATDDLTGQRTWLCVTRASSCIDLNNSTKSEETHMSKSGAQTTNKMKVVSSNFHGNNRPKHQISSLGKHRRASSAYQRMCTLVSKIEAAEILAGETIDFQI